LRDVALGTGAPGQEQRKGEAVREVSIIGAGMTKFGKFLDRSMKELAAEAVKEALDSAGIDSSKLGVAIVGNGAAGLITGQEMIRGQIVLRAIGIGDIPVVNTENACASSSTAFHLAWLYVASGMCDTALVLGMEKLYHEDKRLSFQAIGAATDVESAERQLQTRLQANGDGGGQGEPALGAGAGEKRSLFMDFYAALARQHMERYGTTREQFARVAVKAHYHGSLNPRAQYREAYTLEDTLASPPVVDPLTRLMCAPIGDGAAAVVLCATERARQFTAKPIHVLASVLLSGADEGPDEPNVTERAARKAYEQAGVGPEELDVVEVHDATSTAELIVYEELGLCAPGEGGNLIDRRATYIDGSMPVNPSGGLVSKGHPMGATGAAQIYEIFVQLRGEARDRQVNHPRIGLAENSGGVLGGDHAAACLHIFSV
jgi:acetyl-CoA acetyltransferase